MIAVTGGGGCDHFACTHAGGRQWGGGEGYPRQVAGSACNKGLKDGRASDAGHCTGQRTGQRNGAQYVTTGLRTTHVAVRRLLESSEAPVRRADGSTHNGAGCVETRSPPTESCPSALPDARCDRRLQSTSTAVLCVTPLFLWRRGLCTSIHALLHVTHEKAA